jgi:hypothetical protein
MYLQFYAPATKNIITSNKWKKVKLRLCQSTFEKKQKLQQVSKLSEVFLRKKQTRIISADFFGIF